MAQGEHRRRLHRPEGVRRFPFLPRTARRVASVLRCPARVRPRTGSLHDRARVRRVERAGASADSRSRALAHRRGGDGRVERTLAARPHLQRMAGGHVRRERPGVGDALRLRRLSRRAPRAPSLTCDHSVTYHPTMNDDPVFKALADPTRRLLLDRLFERDGRSLTELESELEMTRFGVMKHLRVLEDAGLVLTRKNGREKLHFLNPVPIRLSHDRWIDKYTERRVSALADLKTQLEETA